MRIAAVVVIMSLAGWLARTLWPLIRDLSASGGRRGEWRWYS